MSVKIKETACMSELKETKQKVMEFETQVTYDMHGIFRNSCTIQF